MASTKERVVLLTTADNPYDPHTQFDDWYQWDTDSGYYTSSYLARVVANSRAISDTDNSLAIEQAIDEIINFNLTGNYKKIVIES